MTLTHTYTPRGACLQVLNRRDGELLISGPAGTGKSRACLEKMHLMALANPGMRGLILRKTQVSLTASGLVTWRRDVIPESEEAGLVSFYGGSAVEPAQYRYSNSSVVVVGGMDKATKIMSTEYDLIYVQEATELTEDDWESLTTRLRSGRVSFQQLIADCNPAQDTHWLLRRTEAARTQMLHSRHEDNPLLFSDDGVVTEFGKSYIAILDALTGVRYRRLRLGEWSSAEGVIYDEWDSAVHFLDPFPIPESWTRYWAVDFGYTNPFVCQWWAEDHDGRLYLYREWYQTKMTVDQHADRILAESKGEPQPRAIICDHDAEGRAQLERKVGQHTLAANKTVTEGIQAVQRRLRDPGDGRPRLFMLRDSLVTPDADLRQRSKPTWSGEEITGYIWDMGKDPPKEVPVKEDDHGMDAMRYMVAHMDLTQRQVKAWSAATGAVG